MDPPGNMDMKIPRDTTFPVLTRPETYDVYGHAYWLAASNLFDCYWGADGVVPTPDYLTMPVLYLLHHYIELELKEVIRISLRCRNEGTKDRQTLAQRRESWVDRPREDRGGKYRTSMSRGNAIA